MILYVFLFLIIGLTVVKCMISRLLSSLSCVIPICYVWITMVKGDLGVFEPWGGAGDQLEEQMI